MKQKGLSGIFSRETISIFNFSKTNVHYALQINDNDGR